MKARYFRLNEAFTLESGAVLPGLDIAYHQYGELNAARDNVIWVCHALTANSEAADWWPGMIGEGRLFDPERDCIICANMIGSCYGSTYALSANPETGSPYFHDFPLLTVRDMVQAQRLLAAHLAIHRIRMVIGGSMGGQQALEWALQAPELIDTLVPIATNARHSPWGIAFNESQRMAIAADSTWSESRRDAGNAGLRAARAIALLSYRNYETYAATQADSEAVLPGEYRAVSYQRYQGDKLARRFDAFAYWTLSHAMDSHHVGRGRGSVSEALGSIRAKTLAIAVSSDILFPVAEQQRIAALIPDAQYVEIDSRYGHDGFLIEVESLTREIRAFLAQ